MASTILLLSTPAAAQESKAQDVHKELAKVEIFAGYSYLHEAEGSLNGWNVALEGNLNRWLALVADFDGHYNSEAGAGTHEYGFTWVRLFCVCG
jgi:hypothetical protein